MGTALFDTTVVPHWRTAGTVTLTKPARLSIGDPCHGLDEVTRRLGAGTWVWEVRDADEHGTSVHRVWEVRIRRDDQPPAVDLDWLDDYSYFRETFDGFHTDGFRGVDAGVIYWRITPHGRRATSYEDAQDLLDNHRFDSEGIAFDDGLMLGTSSGWGDGSYPVAVRLDDGDVVEVRACYITPDPDPITVDDFTRLLPGAFDEDPLTGPFTLHLRRFDRTSMTDGNPDDLADHSYDILDAIEGRDRFGQVVILTNQYGREDRGWTLVYGQSVSKIDTLWKRLPEDLQASIIAASEVVETVPTEPRGWIVKSSESQVRVYLTV